MALITRFDPWHSSLCTCASKLTLNPYTGCDHYCAYCYAASYIPRFHQCRPKKNLIKRLEAEAPRLKGETISISNSSDPYPNLEAEARLTRECLSILAGYECQLQIVTKSDLVARDIDILMKTPSMVSVTITTLGDDIAKILEPDAPDPKKRLTAVESLVHGGIPVSVRVDPIIPFINDEPSSLIQTLADLGVKHVTASTLKMNRETLTRLKRSMPETAGQLEPLYFSQGDRVGRQFYLPRTLRLRLLKRAKVKVEQCGMKFGVCREGFPELNSAVCDGSWLLAKT